MVKIMLDEKSVYYKKRLMFSKGEDFYYLTYSIIFFLHETGALTLENSLKDPRKLAFLVDFISQPFLTDILSKKNIVHNERNRQRLIQSYANGSARIHLIMRLINSLSNKGFLMVEKIEGESQASIYLNIANIPKDFLKSELYEQERENIRYFCSQIKRASSVKLRTMLERIYEDNGISIWHV